MREEAEIDATSTVGNALGGQQNNKTTTIVDSQCCNRQNREALSGHGSVDTEQNKGNSNNLDTETVTLVGFYYSASNAHGRSLSTSGQGRSAPLQYHRISIRRYSGVFFSRRGG